LGRLVWIASYPKSGSTWLRAFLHNYIREPDRPYAINRLMDLTTGESGASLYQGHDPRPASRYTIAEVQRLRPRVHHDLAALAPGPVFVKTHNAALTVAGVRMVTPAVTAAAIYLLRDPRDVAVSYSRHLALPIDRVIAFMADPEAALGGTDHEVYQPLSTWSAHAESWLGLAGAPVHLLRYEDMAETPSIAFGGVVRFLGGEPAQTRLERAIGFSAFAELQAQERREGFIERPALASGAFFGAGRAGRWREVLSSAQRRRIERDHAPLMARFGYLG
jgi:hypothetical protein